MGKIIVKKRNNPFVVIDKTCLQDKSLSWKAKGLLSYLLSLPDEWQIYVQDLKNRSSDGRDSTRTALLELIEHNYVSRQPQRNINGTFAGYIYNVYELPQPTSDIPTSANPKLINNKVNEETSKFIKKRDFDFLKENSFQDKQVEKSSAKNLGEKLNACLIKFKNHLISKKGKKFLTREACTEIVEYTCNLTFEGYSDETIIKSINLAIRTSNINFHPKYIKQQNEQSNDLYENYQQQLYK